MQKRQYRLYIKIFLSFANCESVISFQIPNGDSMRELVNPDILQTRKCQLYYLEDPTETLQQYWDIHLSFFVVYKFGVVTSLLIENIKFNTRRCFNSVPLDVNLVRLFLCRK